MQTHKDNASKKIEMYKSANANKGDHLKIHLFCGMIWYYCMNDDVVESTKVTGRTDYRLFKSAHAVVE